MNDDGAAISGAEEERTLVRPGYLAGPGDPEEALDAFLAEHPTWTRHRPGAGANTVAVSECLTGRIRLDHRPGAGIRWSVVGYESPIGDLAWSVAFDRDTPHEIALAVARRFSAALAHLGYAYEEALWGLASTRTTLAQHLHEAGWRDVSDERRMAFEAPDRSAGLIRWDNGLFHADPGSQDYPAHLRLWAGPPEGTPSTEWRAEFSRNTPTRLITAALHHLTDPLSAARRRSEVPRAHQGLVEMRNGPGTRPARIRAATARAVAAAAPAPTVTHIPPASAPAVPPASTEPGAGPTRKRQ
ncbi:DUF317 domain-containing protein [Kitasatospora sp. NPDC001574]